MPWRIDEPGPRVAAAEFTCSRCGKGAGEVELIGPAEDPRLIARSFVSENTSRVGGEVAALLEPAIREADARRLFELSPEAAPFYCPDCRLCFCREHWRVRDVFDEDGWHDSIRGTCPAGHDRMLED